ncbi:MAG: hypothetical protein K6L73_14910 [Cellvibrionaceae bacterium]
MSLKEAMKLMHEAHMDHVQKTKLEDKDFCQSCEALDKEKQMLLAMQKNNVPRTTLNQKHVEIAEKETLMREKMPMGLMKR